MVAAAKKFRPEESVDEEEGSDNDSEEDQKSARSKSKTQLDESKSIKRIKGPKTQKSETPLVEHKKSKLPPDSDDESQASNLRQAKGKDGKAKGVKLPTVYKKGKWNPNVVLVTKCEQLESKSEVPNFECSARNSNREVIRAAKIGSKRLLDKILESDSKISRLTERWGIENSMTAFKVYIDQGDMEGLIYLLEQLNPAMNKGKTVKYGKDNVVYIKAIDTGFNDKYAYGVATRKVNVSRGGRQGNNAFVEDHKYANIFDDEHITYLVCHQKTTAKDVEKFLGFFPNYEHQLVSKIGDALRAGNTEVAAFLIDRGLKNDGYGLSEFFKLALTAKNEGPLKDIKRPSCTKKAFGVANITPIHCACLNPNSEVLKHILSVNPEYQSLDIQMRKPVHYAACCRSPEPLKFLVSQNVDTREHDNMRTTPLMYAARAGQVENVKFLLQENRSIVMAKDKHGYSAIHYAAEYGHPEIIKLILDAGVKIAMGGPDRKAALHIAAAKGDLETVKFLVDQGAKVTAKDKFKRTPLLLACRNGNLAIASYLLQQGSPFDEADSSGNSPLHYACAYGYPEIIGALLQAGANPNAVNSWNLSPTAVALLKSYFSCLRRMLDDPATNVNCIDDEGRTLVSNAIKTIDAQNFNHVAFLLRDKKADPNIPDAKGLTAFDYLCAHNVDSLAQAEVKSDMSLDQINALKAEKRSLYRKYFTLFLESQADINHKDVNGLTPIFRSLQSSNVDGLELLLQQRSLDLDVISNTNNSVYHYVEYVVLQDGFFKLMKQLISKAPKHELMNLYNDGGKTPLHMIFGKFMGKLPDLKSQILAELTKELKLKKKQDRKTKGNTKLSQTMDAEGDDEYDDDDDECSDDDDDFGFKEKRMPMKKMKAATKYHGLKGGARMMHRGGFGMKIRATTEDSQLGHNLESVALTTEETQNLEKEAENLFKDRLEEFFEFLRYFQNSGARVTDLIKDPKKPKSTPEGEEGEIDEEDMDYSVEDYFERIYRMLENSVQSKINLPDKKKPSNEVGYSLLHLACSSNNQAVIDFIIKDYKIPVNQRSVYGESELLKFISSNSPSDQSVAVLESLIKKNCDVELANIHAQTPILLAMVLSKDKFILPLIRYKANVNAQDVKGNYPLLQAIKHKSLQMVEILLANNASPNLTDKQRRNSIHWAINLSNADADASNEIENCLLSSGGDLNAVDSRGRCPLHYAFVKIGDPFNKSNIDPIETVSNIISRPGVKVDVRDRWGNTALSYAAQRGAVISALYLLKNMADIDNVNEDGNTPLNICLLNGHQNMSIFLIQKNCKLKVDVKIKKEDERPDDMQESDDELKVNKADQDFESNPYMQKSMMRRPKKAMKKRRKDEEKEEIEYESSESILDEKEDEEEQEDISNMAGNPFGGGSFGMSKGFGYGGGFAKRAAAFGSYQTSQMQVNDAPDNLKLGKKEKTCSTFSIAIRRNWQSVAFLMLEFGFDLSLAILDCFAHKKYNYVYTLLLKKAEAGVYQTTNAEGQNLTHLFAQNSSKISDDLYTKILNKLDSKGLDFGSADSSGRTSLHYASEAGCIKLVKWLLERGLDINHEDAGNVTPLGHVLKSSFHKAEEFASEGINCGLDFNKEFYHDGKFHTALTFIVAEEKNISTFIKLCNMGADINKGDSDGWTPIIHLIRQNRDEEIKNFVKQFRTLYLACVDKEGRNIIHHIVSPRDFGSYENVALLEMMAKLVDVNHKDNKGRPPLFYAKQQDSGRMEKALLKCKAKEYEIEETFVRAGTSALSAMKFPENTTNYEEDFNRFIEQCKEEAKNEKKDAVEKCQVDPNATGNYEVCYDGEDPYDCYMVKVDISYGYYSGNTFYRMQLLREKVRDVYILFTRWGRVGTPGQYQQTPFSNIEDCRKEYCSVFKSKTGNMWEDRHSFVKVDKKYRLVPVVKKHKVENYIKAFNYKDPRLPPTQLDKPIYKMIRRVCNYKVISTAIKFEYHIDSNVLPLQNISRERLLDAEAILKGISNTLEQYQKAREKRDLKEITQLAEDLSQLSSEFYELIPTDKYQTESIPPITNPYNLGELRKMLNDLIYFEIAIKMLGAATFNIKTINPIDYIHKCMNFKILLLNQRSDEFKLLREYVQKGRQGQSMKNLISNIYAVERKDEREQIKSWHAKGNRMLLWHGTRGENLIGIIQTGFRIAPSDARRTGAMFGEGVYFSDIFNKCFQYAQTANYNVFSGNVAKKAPKKYMFLCEVVLGKMKRLSQAQNVTDLPNEQFQSVMGYGRVGPNPLGNIYMSNGCVIPLGNLVSNPPLEGDNRNDGFNSLQYNEYVVYNTTQIRIRYIVELREIEEQY